MTSQNNNEIINVYKNVNESANISKATEIDYSIISKEYSITSKGYKIPLDDKKVNDIKKELMILPYGENMTRYPVFRMSEKYLYIPKYYGLKKLGKVEIIKEQEGQNIEIEFKGKLRDYQIETCNKILKYINDNQSGLASIYTGWGKTCGALWILSRIKKQTLVIVHTENLLNQWKEKIIEFLGIEEEDIGIIQGPNVIVENKKVVLGMIQSISMKEYTNETFKNFGFTIFDECHTTPSRVFSRVFYKIGTKYNLGLSATLTRADGLTKVIKYFLGETIVNLRLSIITPKITIKYTTIEPIEEKKMVNGKVSIPLMENELCRNFERNLEIITLIKKKYNENRKILVLSARVEHCRTLQRLMGDQFSTGLYIGGMKNEALKESNKQRVIFGTYKMASVGYDNPELDTLVFATPKSNIEQAVGRILRQENKNEAEVIDFVDAFSIFNFFYFARIKFYQRKKYFIDYGNGKSNGSNNSNESTNFKEIEKEVLDNKICLI